MAMSSTTSPAEKPKDINLINHEVLKTLRRVGMTIVKTGSEEKGHTGLYKFQEGSASLQFGMLVALLNDYDKYSQYGQEQSTFLSQRKIKVEVVEATPYNWNTVAKAVEILEYNKHIKDETTGKWLEIEDRQIQLTKEGLIAFDTDFYVLESEKIRDAKALRDSTFETEKAVRITGKATVKLYWATMAIAFVTLVGVVLPFINDSEKNNLRSQVKELEKQLQLKQQPPPQPKGNHPPGQPLPDSANKRPPS